MNSGNRRKHFRIEMVIPLTWQVLTDEEVKLMEKGMAKNILTRAQPPSPIDEFLAEAAPGSRDEQLYRCLKLVNNKLDFLIGRIFLESAENPPMRDKAVEISGSGLKFFTRTELGKGAFLRMSLIMPGTFQFQIDMISEVVRVEQAEGGYVIAAKILNIDEADRDAIVKVVFQKQREEIRRGKTGQGDHDVH